MSPVRGGPKSDAFSQNQSNHNTVSASQNTIFHCRVVANTQIQLPPLSEHVGRYLLSCRNTGNRTWPTSNKFYWPLLSYFVLLSFLFVHWVLFGCVKSRISGTELMPILYISFFVSQFLIDEYILINPRD